MDILKVSIDSLSRTNLEMSLHSFGDIPLPGSVRGRELYQRGRRLVQEFDLRLDDILWDADEVLWDWLMDAGRMLTDLRSIVRGSVAHREWLMAKPGVLELIWGMRHASLELGEPAHIKIWTNGYPWRLWRIAREIPGLVELLGPPADDGPEGHRHFRSHPRIFSRLDYIEVAERLLSPARRRQALERLPRAARSVIDEQFRRDPYDSSLKIPELAELVGKEQLVDTGILVDDQRSNVARFAATGRRGVHVVSHTPHVLFGNVPNTVWANPADRIRDLDNDVGEGLAEALRELATSSPPRTVRAEPVPRSEAYPTLEFVIDVPDERLRSEWLEPMRALKRA